MHLEALHSGDVFALVTFDALDEDFGRGAGFLGAGFRQRGFGFFFLRVFEGAFLGVDGEAGEGGVEGF